MRTSAPFSDEDGTILVQIPLRLRQRGGRKLVVTPEGTSAWTPPRARIDTAMVKAIARAFRWRKMLENGQYSTLREIAEAEKINESYVSRVLRLTLLAPEIVEMILNGRQPIGLQLDDLMKRFPIDWSAQREFFGAQ
jgi:hypothetical protein